MSPRQASIGDRELALLRWIAERGGATVGEAAEEYGAPRDLARSTVLTMMERLRGKGHLTRRRVDGVYRYASAATPRELMRGVVEGFVEHTLGGSLSPFSAYLAEAEQVSDEELAELENIVARLKSQREGEP
jgi:predicted transcriptional regulator